MTAALLLLVFGCKTPRPTVPGHTSDRVVDVRFDGGTVGLGILPEKLGMRTGNLIMPGQNYNAFRAAEDKRRVKAYWMTRGFLDVVVDGPLLARDDATGEVVVTWKIREGRPYAMGRVEVRGAPPELQKALVAMVPFSRGDEVDDIQNWRLHRVAMSEFMRARGYAHAETLSRLFIEKKKGLIHWIYFVDSGPRTRVGKVVIHGARKVPEALILRRLNLPPGAPYDHTVRRKAEQDLLDLGSFTVVFIKDTSHNEFLIGALPPDQGGSFQPGRVDADGKPLGRLLSAEVDLDVTVTESPASTGRVGVGFAADSERVDGQASLKGEFRDLLGPTHHVLIDGRMGYGILFRGETGDPLGLYGDGLLRYDHPGFLHRHLDLRLYAQWKEDLFDAFHQRGLRSGFGLRTHLADRVFLDLDLAYRLQWSVGLPDFDDATRSELRLDPAELAIGQLKLAFLIDRRDNRIEALSGYLLGVDALWSPGGFLGSHAFLNLGFQARSFLKLGAAFGMGLRLAGRWVWDIEGQGLPSTARLFAGGPFGMRGFSHNDLTTRVRHCEVGACRTWGVGALSVAEATLDLRWLPFRKQVGANAFIDVGGASVTANPLAEGVSVALGLGGRVRLWYIPLSLDLSYRVTEAEALADLGRWLFFARIGESF